MTRCFCPRCGKEMVTEFVEGDLVGGRCVDGGLDLSGVAAKLIQEAFLVDEGEPQAGGALSFTAGGDWFCPRDGERMDEGRQGIRCRKCGRSFSARLVHQLVELHRHS